MESQVLEPDPSAVDHWRQFRTQLANASDEERAALFAARSNTARRAILRTIYGAGQGHIGGDFSVIDILTVLFGSVLDIDPLNPRRDQRDHLILSKGHASASLYTVLAQTGFFSVDQLDTFMRPMSSLNGHPNRLKVPGVEANTGPLGHGLPIAVGTAVGLRLSELPNRVFVIVGDGELQEGSNWEALMAASQFDLSNLVVIVDRNTLQQGARTEQTNALDPLDQKMAAFGAEVRTVAGHDYLGLESAFGPARGTSPVAVIARTTKGKGVSFIEDQVGWHHRVPTAEEAATALEELS